MTWNTFSIGTPKGNFETKSDDLAAEIRGAARYAGIKHPVVKVNGCVIDDPKDLPTNSITALQSGTTVTVGTYDTAG